MNVEIDYIQGKIALTILADDFFDDCLRIITVPALLNTQSPQWYQRHVARELGITIKNFLDRWSIEKIIVQLTAFGTEPDTFLGQSAEIKIATIAVIKENPIGRCPLQSDIERDRLVDRIAPFGVTGGVGMPVHE